jgi:hypothetical protein
MRRKFVAGGKDEEGRVNRRGVETPRGQKKEGERGRKRRRSRTRESKREERGR